MIKNTKTDESGDKDISYGYLFLRKVLEEYLKEVLASFWTSCKLLRGFSCDVIVVSLACNYVVSEIGQFVHGN